VRPLLAIPVPGLTRDLAYAWTPPVPGLTRDPAQSGGCHMGVKEVPAQGRDGRHSAGVLMHAMVETTETEG